MKSKPVPFSFLRVFQPPAPLSSAAAFSALYERAHLPVFRYLYGLTGGPQQEVEDLAAETFTRAWKRRHFFQGDDGAALGWLLQIARRLVIDAYRRRKVREAGPDLLPAPAPAPEDSAQRRDDQRTLLALLRSLPEEPREILTLRYLLGWQVNQIAGHLGLTENHVSVILHRAIERLRQSWPQAPEE